MAKILRIPDFDFEVKRAEVFSDMITGTLICRLCGCGIGIILKCDRLSRKPTEWSREEILHELARQAIKKHGPNCECKHDIYNDPKSLMKFLPDIVEGYEKHKEEEHRKTKSGIYIPGKTK